MKFILIVLSSLVCITSVKSQSPIVYINLNSHNETSGTGELNYDNPSSRADYDTAYKYIKQVADMVIAKGVKYNFQSDVKFLFGCLKWDLKTAATNNTNLLKWMDDSPNIECDPHSHEAKYPPFGALGKIYNYADVAHLHDSLGVTNRKNVGGFKVDGLQNQTHWPSMETGLQGKAYSTSGIWQPNVLWGGSYKVGVHNDMNFFGSFKPTLDTINFATNSSNSSQRLRIQGNGCSMVFHDSTNEQRIIKELSRLFRNVHYGVYPNTEFYTPVLQINCRDVYKPNYVKRLTTIIDSINNYVALGWVNWKTISEKDAIWTSTIYNSANKRIDCSSLPTSINNSYQVEETLQVFPNPAKDMIEVSSQTTIDKIIIYDLFGRLVTEVPDINNIHYKLSIRPNNEGMYFVSIYHGNGTIVTKKILLE